MEEKRVYIVVVLIQLMYAGNYIFCKDVLNGGMPTTIFSFYRLLFATLLFVPLALAFGRKNAPKMSWRIVVKIFFLALFGTTFVLNIFAIGVEFTSSTVTSAITNAIPVVTFALAVLLRMESVAVKRITGIAKIVGIMLCVAGVMILAFYEGPNLDRMESVRVKRITGIAKIVGIMLCVGGVMILAFYEGPNLESVSHHHRPFLHGSNGKINGAHSKLEWIIGTFILIFFAVAWSLWIILQGPILKEYPSKLLFSTLCTLFGTMQSFFVALIAERDFNKWKLHLDDTLLGVLYSGTIASGVAFYLQAWCIDKKGPVFIAIWQPLSLLITLACSSFFLGENIKLGSVLGGLLMVGGLYSVLWGKQRDNSEEEPSTEKEINGLELPISTNSTNEDHAILEQRMKVNCTN